MGGASACFTGEECLCGLPMRGLKIDGRLPSYCRQQDDLVEIGIRLKAHFHGRAGSCRPPTCIRKLLIEHRVLLTGGLAHRLELRFGCFEIGIYF